MKVLKGHTIMKGEAEGEALVTADPIEFLGGIDPETGIIVEKGHELEGVCVKEKILVFPYGKGSTGGTYRIYEMLKRNVAPKAIVNIRADPISAIGAVISNIPMMHRFDKDPVKTICTGDFVRVDANNGIVEILRTHATF